MINQEMEKEVQQDNKVIAGLNIRQVVCLGIAGSLCIIISLFLDVGFEPPFVILNVSDDVIGYSGKLSEWFRQ